MPDVGFEHVASHASVAIYRTNTHGLCTYANQALCDLFELPLEKILGVGWTQRVYPEDRERVRNWIFGQRLYAVAPREYFTLEYRLQLEHRTICVSANSCALVDGAGDFMGRTGIISEVTAARPALR